MQSCDSANRCTMFMLITHLRLKLSICITSKQKEKEKKKRNKEIRRYLAPNIANNQFCKINMS